MYLFLEDKRVEAETRGSGIKTPSDGQFLGAHSQDLASTSAS